MDFSVEAIIWSQLHKRIQHKAIQSALGTEDGGSLESVSPELRNITNHSFISVHIHITL